MIAIYTHQTLKIYFVILGLVVRSLLSDCEANNPLEL